MTVNDLIKRLEKIDKNKMCYISLGFDKSLLEIINGKVENNE